MIKHIKCDIFDSGADIILHQVNCQGVMGSGVAKQVRERFPRAYEEYKDICNSHARSDDLLGMAHIVHIPGSKVSVGNLFAQDGYGYDGKCHTDYSALKHCFQGVKNILETAMNYKKEFTIAIPYKIGCARGGGDWNVVYKIIEDAFADSADLNVLICECDKG